MDWTKLDTYDYSISDGIIRINLNGGNDPILVDIMSEINRSNGKIYVEGQRFSYLDDYKINNEYRNSYLELYVEKM